MRADSDFLPWVVLTQRRYQRDIDGRAGKQVFPEPVGTYFFRQYAVAGGEHSEPHRPRSHCMVRFASL